MIDKHLNRIVIGLMLLSVEALLCVDAHAGGSTTTMLAYSKSGQSTAFYRTWDGAAWSAEGATSNLSGEARWVVLKSCPKRDEITLTALLPNGGTRQIQFAAWNGVTWGAATQLEADSDNIEKDRTFDHEYEQRSGRALMAYWDKPNLKVGYRTYDGTTLSAESLLALPSAARARYIAMYARPKSNDIIMLVLNESKTLYATVWNGSSWGAVTTLISNTGYNDSECFGLVFESVSKQAIVTYAKDATDIPRYRTWDGTSWSAENSMPSVGKKERWHKLVADPWSDTVIFGSLDDSNDINLIVWNGSSWGAAVEIENDTQHKNRRQFDIAFEYGGTKAVVAYCESNKNEIRYRTFNGTSWSAEQLGPNMGNKQRVFVTRTGLQDGEVFILCSDDSNELEFCLWNGTSMSAKTTLCSGLGALAETEQFTITIPDLPWQVVQWHEVERTE